MDSNEFFIVRMWIGFCRYRVRRTKRGPAEQAGKNLDHATEKTTESMKETMDNTGAAINDAAEKTGEGVKEAVE